MKSYYVYWSFGTHTPSSDWCRTIVQAHDENGAKSAASQIINNHMAIIQNVKEK